MAFLTSLRPSMSSLSSLLKFMSLTCSPKKREKKMLGPVLDLSNILTVNSAKAIDKGLFPTFFLTPASEKKILTKIYPISNSVSWTTLKSIALLSDELIFS